MRRRDLIPSIVLLGTLLGCTEQALAPGACPDFCPGGTITMHDTVLGDAIVRDSAFRGYVQAHRGEVLPLAEVPGVVSSRAIFQLAATITRVTPDPPDTTTVPITVDSARLRLVVARRDTNTANLQLRLYRMPLGLDSTTTLAALAPWFQDSLVDSVNVSELLALPLISDSLIEEHWGDSIRTDSAGHVLQIDQNGRLVLHFTLDTTRLQLAPEDSGRVAFGVRVAAESLPTAALGAIETGNGATISWFYSYPDTVIKLGREDRGSVFDSYIVDPPFAPVGEDLVVGGTPSARSLLRVGIPPFLRDSADVVRATLVLVPVAPVHGVRSDSFGILVRPVLTDIGAKSPLNTLPSLASVRTIPIGSDDTVRIEMTTLIRNWALDTAAATAFVLSILPEAGTYAEIRFYSSRTDTTAAQRLRPRLHVTYVRRFPFGEP